MITAIVDQMQKFKGPLDHLEVIGEITNGDFLRMTMGGIIQTSLKDQWPMWLIKWKVS